MPLVKYSELTSTPTEFVARCLFPNCKCRIISSSSVGSRITIKNLPNMLRLSKSTASTDGAAKERFFYQVADLWLFDNIGVSKKILEDHGDVMVDESPVHVQRVLVCSDCDRGPIGFAGIVKGDDEDDVEKLVYFLHDDSVLYDIKDN